MNKTRPAAKPFVTVTVCCLLLGVCTLAFGKEKQALTEAEFDKVYKKTIFNNNRQPITRLFVLSEGEALKNYIRWFLKQNPSNQYKMQIYDLLRNNKRHHVLQEVFFGEHNDLRKDKNWEMLYWRLFDDQSEFGALSKAIIEYYVRLRQEKTLMPADFQNMRSKIKGIQSKGAAPTFAQTLDNNKNLSAFERAAFRLFLYGTSDLPKVYEEWLSLPKDPKTETHPNLESEPIVREVYSRSSKKNLLRKLYVDGEFYAYLKLIEHWGWNEPKSPNYPFVKPELQMIALQTGHNPNNLPLPETAKKTLFQLNQWFAERNYINIINTFHGTEHSNNMRFLIAAIEVHRMSSDPELQPPSPPEGYSNAVDKSKTIRKRFRLKSPYIWLDALRRNNLDFFIPYYKEMDTTELHEKQILFRAVLQNNDVNLEQLVQLYSKIIFQDDDMEKHFELQQSNLSPMLRDYIVYWAIEDYHELGQPNKLKTFYERHINGVRHPPALQQAMYLYAKSILFKEPKKARQLMNSILVRFPKTHLRFLIEGDMSKIL